MVDWNKKKQSKLNLQPRTNAIHVCIEYGDMTLLYGNNVVH